MDKTLTTEIYEACNIIQYITKDTDILLFVGQSSNLLYHVLKNRKNTFAIPFSGAPKPKKSDIKNYIDVLQDIGITKETFDTDSGIYIIDYISTGICTRAFINTINRCFNMNLIYNVIYWSEEETFALASNKRIGIIHRLEQYMNCDKIYNLKWLGDDGYRTIPSYSIKLWSDKPKYAECMGSFIVDDLLKFHSRYNKI
jgi:hypothetical protein